MTRAELIELYAGFVAGPLVSARSASDDGFFFTDTERANVVHQTVALAADLADAVIAKTQTVEAAENAPAAIIARLQNRVDFQAGQITALQAANTQYAERNRALETDLARRPAAMTHEGEPLGS